MTSALAERQLSSVCSSQAALADYLYFWLALRNLSQTTTTTTRMINRAASLIVPILRIGAAAGATPLPAWLSLVERERFPENLHKLEFPLWRLLTLLDYWTRDRSPVVRSGDSICQFWDIRARQQPSRRDQASLCCTTSPNRHPKTTALLAFFRAQY